LHTFATKAFLYKNRKYPFWGYYQAVCIILLLLAVWGQEHISQRISTSYPATKALEKWQHCIALHTVAVSTGWRADMLVQKRAAISSFWTLNGLNEEYVRVTNPNETYLDDI
jgi:hypothetical protein